LERKFNQTPGDTNVAILGYLTKMGTWMNLRQITTGTPGSDLNRERLRSILESFSKKSFVEIRESQNPKAKFEYKITEKGRATFQRCISFDPDVRYVIGLKEFSED